MTIGTAGLPIDLMMSRDYDAIFSALADAGIDVFCPTTIYEEIPVPKGLGYENDLLPPPYGTASSEIFDLARDHGIKIAYSADYMFPIDNGGVNPSSSLLQALIDAGARDIIHSIVNYDEPVWNGLDVSHSQAVYQHVKNVDPSIQVSQIHAPVHSNDPTEYLDDVKEHAQWADTVGFDVYPIGGTQSGARTPYNPDRLVEPNQALQEYVTWLEAEFPNKSHIMVLQAFELNDLYSDEAVDNMSAAEKAASRSPTLQEMQEMMQAVQGVDEVFWWGPSLLDEASDSDWLNLLTVSQSASGSGSGSGSGNNNSPIGPLTDVNTKQDGFDEDADNGSFVGVTLKATDPDAGDAVFYSLDDARFGVDSKGRVFIKNNDTLDFETESSITINATALSTDASDSTLSFTLTVNDVVEQINGTVSDDTILGASGGEAIIARRGHDSISGAAGDDYIKANRGRDIVLGGDGNDSIGGGKGSDVLSGGNGDDSIVGNIGRDTITGGNGNDILKGGQGDDVIQGTAGNNFINGSLGSDQLQGGTGADQFKFKFGDGTDYIFDFDVTQDTLLFDGPASMADLSISTNGNVTVIDYKGGQIGIFDIAPSDLSGTNFDFI